jgi:hypothetical protein
MTTVVLKEVGIALAFFAMPLWAFGIHWEAFATGSLLVALDAYMAHRRGQRAREALGVLLWIGSNQVKVV